MFNILVRAVAVLSVAGLLAACQTTGSEVRPQTSAVATPAPTAEVQKDRYDPNLPVAAQSPEEAIAALSGSKYVGTFSLNQCQASRVEVHILSITLDGTDARAIVNSLDCPELNGKWIGHLGRYNMLTLSAADRKWFIDMVPFRSSIDAAGRVYWQPKEPETVEEAKAMQSYEFTGVKFINVLSTKPLTS